MISDMINGGRESTKKAISPDRKDIILLIFLNILAAQVPIDEFKQWQTPPRSFRGFARQNIKANRYSTSHYCLFTITLVKHREGRQLKVIQRCNNQPSYGLINKELKSPRFLILILISFDFPVHIVGGK